LNTQISPLASYRGSSTAMDRRGWNLALSFQEVFTAIVRLRSRRQEVTSADTFRGQMKRALQAAEQDALSRGYNQEDVRRVLFAVVAFLDESVLGSRDPVFADWPRLPLQAELYHHQLAGEIVFQELQKVLSRNDSLEVADVLEVFYLCLLLGFQGRYAAGGRGELQMIMNSIREKIRRVRGAGAPLSPAGGIPNDVARISKSDPLIRKLAIATVIVVALTLASFLIFKVVLASGAAGLVT